MLFTMAYYWFSSGDRGMGLAYAVAILNGTLGVVINTMLSQVPGQEGMLIFNISSIWIVLTGARGLQRLKKQRILWEVTSSELPHDAELLGYVDDEGYVEHSTRKLAEEWEDENPEDVPAFEEAV